MGTHVHKYTGTHVDDATAPRDADTQVDRFPCVLVYVSTCLPTP